MMQVRDLNNICIDHEQNIVQHVWMGDYIIHAHALINHLDKSS
jgi:hypothetical protein